MHSRNGALKLYGIFKGDPTTQKVFRVLLQPTKPSFCSTSNSITACCSGGAKEDLANISYRFPFSHSHHLTMKYRLSVLTHQRLLL